MFILKISSASEGNAWSLNKIINSVNQIIAADTQIVLAGSETPSKRLMYANLFNPHKTHVKQLLLLSSLLPMRKFKNKDLSKVIQLISVAPGFEASQSVSQIQLLTNALPTKVDSYTNCEQATSFIETTKIFLENLEFCLSI